MVDPVALLTDSILGVAAWVFAARLWRANRMWALAFVFTGVGAVCGGVFHAFGDQWLLLWKTTTFSVGLASFFLLAGADRRLQGLAVVKLVVYLSWMSGHDAFEYVIADYGLTLILLAFFHPAKKWVIGSIALSIAGALVQQTRFTIHERWLDFNDLYHFIQLVALWMLYRAALEWPKPQGEKQPLTT
jgi:hypothetical protein